VCDDVDGAASREVHDASPDVLRETLDGRPAGRVAEVVNLIAASCGLTGNGPQRPSRAPEPVKEDE
jgi:hypothetical protein